MASTIVNIPPVGINDCIYTINTLIADRDKFQSLNNELQSKLDEAHVYRDTLIDKLRKHDLAKLSLQKPGLVETRINNGTKRLFRELEELSGSKPDTVTAPK